MHRVRPVLLALVAAVLVGLGPTATPVAAAPGSTAGYTLDYTVTATGTLDRTYTKLALTETLSITAPETGMTSLVLGVLPRGFSAWTTTATTVDGVAVPVTWSTTIGMTFDLSAAPWEPGTTHEVVVSGVIDFARSTAPNARLRRIGSGSTFVLTAGDFLPLPTANPRWPVYADPLNAALARSITMTLTAPSTVANDGVAMSGDQSVVTSGRSWTSTIAPARSFAFVLAPAFRTSTTSFTLTGANGVATPVRVSAVGNSSITRGGDLSTGAVSVKWLWSRFGAGPYTNYKIVSVPVVDAAHEFPGLLMIGSNYTSALRRVVTRHEVAHQWWYGLVNSDQTTDPWMDESLAEYSARRIGGANSPYRIGACTRKIDGPNYASSTYYAGKFGTNGFFECIYLRGMNVFYALGNAMGGQPRLEACLKRYAQDHRFAAPGPVVLAQYLRDCDERTLPVLRAWLSAATVDATK
jgi:hypothetical protein